METAHQLARELPANPDLSIYHFDPSGAGQVGCAVANLLSANAWAVTGSKSVPLLLVRWNASQSDMFPPSFELQASRA